MLAKVIGTPATLENLAEECTELAHAALKCARIIRDESPTPDVTIEKAQENLTEEAAHVLIMLNEVIFETDMTDYERVEGCKRDTMERMLTRINEFEMRKNREELTWKSSYCTSGLDDDASECFDDCYEEGYDNGYEEGYSIGLGVGRKVKEESADIYELHTVPGYVEYGFPVKPTKAWCERCKTPRGICSRCVMEKQEKGWFPTKFVAGEA